MPAGRAGLMGIYQCAWMLNASVYACVAHFFETAHGFCGSLYCAMHIYLLHTQAATGTSMHTCMSC